MKHLFNLSVLILLFSVSATAQTTNQGFVSKKDSTLLFEFWRGFKKSVNEHNKIDLSKYFNFPFYCSPCLDYIETKDSVELDNPPRSLKVTRKIFQESAYKLFFKIPTRNKLTKELWGKKFVFRETISDKNKRDGFQFSVALVPPSKNWEGSQAFVYLKKKNGRFVIVGIDHIP